jgi:hypothetical protein
MMVVLRSIGVALPDARGPYGYGTREQRLVARSILCL